MCVHDTHRSVAFMTRPSVHELLDLAGQTAVVTGASGNIGAAIARRLHEAGANVALHASGSVDGIARATELAADLGARAVVVSGDVERDAESICHQIERSFGDLSILVNNAAIQPVKSLLELEKAEVSEILRINVGGAIAMTRQAARLMHASGAIVNVASIEGLQPAVGHSHYSATKAALIMHTRSAANELGPLGIRVNAVSPGLIHVDGLAGAWPEGVARWLAACPLGRVGEATDVADAVLFLCSPAARWITGANLIVDGGILTNNAW